MADHREIRGERRAVIRAPPCTFRTSRTLRTCFDLDIPVTDRIPMVLQQDVAADLRAERADVLELARLHGLKNLWATQLVLEHLRPIQPMLDVIPLDEDP